MTDREGMETLDMISGVLTAQRFVFENLLAMLIHRDPAPLDTCKRLRDEMLRQFEELPARNADGRDSAEVFAVTQHGLHHLERMWAGVEGRLRQAK